MFAKFTTDRDWPWRDGDLLGWPGLLAIAGVLVLLTLWTYSGQRQVGWRKLLAILGLRLAALIVIVLLLLRPSYANEEEVVTPGRLIIVLDNSLSMKINDAPNDSTRWAFVRKLLQWPEVKDALQQLQREKQIDIVYYQAAEDVRRYDPTSDADGMRTDIGKWLFSLWNAHHNDRNLRGLLLFTDGADNGTSHPLLGEAGKWRELACPIQPFGAGSPETNKSLRNIAIVDVKAEKEAVFVKNIVPIKAIIDAPNLEGQNVTIRLFVDDKPVSVKENVTLPNTRGNVVDVGTIIPEQVGEIKVTVKVDEVPGEFTPLDNEMSTYMNVRKEGISILWVEGRKRLEAAWILRHALASNPRFSIVYDERTRDGPLTAEQSEYFKTPEKTFDVVVVGDITASRFFGGDNALIDRFARAVNSRRTGLLMLGGYQTYGNNDWQAVAKSLADLLPVDLAATVQLDEKVRALPVDANKSHRLLQLNVPPDKDLWGDLFKPLDGQVKLAKIKKGAIPLLATEAGELLVVTGDDGPRVAVFGGDTTHLAWFDNDDAVRAFERFWSQIITWLARQEEGNNQVWVKLDRRRLAVGANQKLGFSVGADGKDGQPIRNARFTVKVQGPGGEIYDVNTATKLGDERGAFSQANAVGEYKVIVTATAPRPSPLAPDPLPLGTATARFMGFAEDVENQQPAADYKNLINLAAAGGGTFRIAGKEELLQYLQELRDRSGGPGWVKREVWPNWKMPPASDALADQLGALFQSLALPCLVLFVLCLGTEWFLRRWWGLV
jgi:hypothetical protein